MLNDVRQTMSFRSFVASLASDVRRPISAEQESRACLASANHPVFKTRCRNRRADLLSSGSRKRTTHTL
jgi:hypothetical protein